MRDGNVVCGDGEVQELNGEECDDGNKVVTDDCVGESHDHRDNLVLGKVTFKSNALQYCVTP